MKRDAFFYFGLMMFIFSFSVSNADANKQRLGESGYKNVVILGENISSENAKAYANKYNARVLYKPGRGFLANAVSNSMRGTLGPSKAMKDIIRELQSINNTDGAWKLIIPSLAEKYFLVTLRNMKDSVISNARGQIILPDSQKNKEVEQEVLRVFGNKFEVIYTDN